MAEVPPYKKPVLGRLPEGRNGSIAWDGVCMSSAAGERMAEFIDTGEGTAARPAIVRAVRSWAWLARSRSIAFAIKYLRPARPRDAADFHFAGV
jgi:hypothetical protein